MNWLAFFSEQWLLVSILVVLIIALVTVEKQRGGAVLNLHEITRLVNADEAILLDVREGKEFSAGHIASAINIPFAKIDTRITELEKSRHKTIVVLDKMGQHAGAVAKQLRESGYKVVRMQGGMSEWQAQNLPVVKT